jgi:nuclear GTP-binding protein
LTSSSKAIGADKLLELIKNYSKTDGVKGAVTVGVIGYPNVGKSSVINSLKRTKACGVSSTPGFTKGLQEVIIDQKVKIIDCPGVVFDSKNKESLLLRNIVKLEQLEDPREPVEEIIQRVSKNELLLAYKIGDFSDVTEFLV